MTQPQEKLLSSEMNLLNNLYLMGLSVIFCFCTYLCSSRPSPQLRYCALLFCVLFLSRLFILRLLCAPVRFVRGDSDCFQKAKRILKYKLLLIVFSCFSSHTRRCFCPRFSFMQIRVAFSTSYSLILLCGAYWQRKSCQVSVYSEIKTLCCFTDSFWDGSVSLLAVRLSL